MATYRYPIIARESWLLLGLITLSAIVATYMGHVFIAILFWSALVALMFLFRDPYRQIPSSPLAIVSPVDGRVVDIREEYDSYLERDAIRVEMKMNRFGIYSIRSPIEGKVLQRWVKRRNRQAGQNATQLIQWIQSDEQDDVIIFLNKDLITRRPGCTVHSGDRMGQGQRCGFLHFGIGRIILFLPVNCRIDVKQRDKVRAGSDIIATLIHN